MISTRPVTTLDELATLEEVWQDLLGQSSADQVFLTWSWLYTWTKYYLGSHRLLVLLMTDGPHLIGIAPLYIKVETAGGIAGLRRVVFLGTGEVCSGHLDLIARDDRKHDVVSAVLSYLFGEARPTWDLLTLQDIPAESTSIDSVEQVIGEAGKVMEISGHTCSPTIRLPTTGEEFLAGISGNARAHLKSKRRRLDAAGTVRFECLTSPDDARERFPQFVALYRTRWEGRAKGDQFQSPAFWAFHREMVEVLGRRDQLRLHFLLLDGEPIAGIYAVQYEGRSSFYLPAFDPTTHADSSPGILLLSACVQRAIQETSREFDLLRGAAPYKMAWSNAIRRSLTLQVYNRDLRAAGYRLVESGKSVIKVLCR
ncbi:MAG: GNAT family N-acetyltransferase [Nitrospiria bacterium]